MKQAWNLFDRQMLTWQMLKNSLSSDTIVKRCESRTYDDTVCLRWVTITLLSVFTLSNRNKQTEITPDEPNKYKYDKVFINKSVKIMCLLTVTLQLIKLRQNFV